MAAGWFAAGKTLGVAVDLDAGTVLVSVDGADWAVAFLGCAPGAAVGAGLFPALSGKNGARVRCNWGADESRPMQHAPPASEYRAVGLLLQQKVRAPVTCPPLHTHSQPSASIAFVLHWCVCAPLHR